MKKYIVAATFLLMVSFQAANAGPVIIHDRKELEAVMETLIAWLPGEWDSFPQVYYERNVSTPETGEHEHWYRTFARIDAPHVGDVVFYGQINIEGRDGPIYSRSQVLYKAEIDEGRGVVSITGQPIANAEKFENLQDHPELWSQIPVMDLSAVKCDFIWRRHGDQLVGLIDSKVPERRKNGPGTCSYMSERSGEEFMSDAEWVLTPERLWLYDINTMGGKIFIGREDRTHTKLYRAQPYTCSVQDVAGKQLLNAHDRGFTADVTLRGGRKGKFQLLRADYPAADGFGLDDRLQAMITDAGSQKALESTSLPPLSKTIKVTTDGVVVECKRAEKFPPMVQN